MTSTHVDRASGDALNDPQTSAKKTVKFPPVAPVRGILRHPTASNNVTMERFLRSTEEAEEASVGEPRAPPMDMILKRPCTPNHQYSCMTERQIQNVQDRSRSNPLFRHEKPHWMPDKRYYMDRYATCTSQYLLRDQPGSEPWCWIDQQWQREPPEQHNTSRFGASVPWGPEKMGSRTYSHFDGEDVYRYVLIDMYCRPPSNVVGPVVHKFGRAPSYYHQRKPHTKTWFGSSHELNRTDVLQDTQPKNQDEYIIKWDMEKLKVQGRTGKWPEFSEYTDRFTLRSPMPRVMTRLQRNKLHVADTKQAEE